MTEQLRDSTNWITINSIVPYAGGKSRVAGFLANLFPTHELYVDLFCGMLSVTLSKPRSLSRTEWLNDKYNGLINFLVVIRDKYQEFIDYFLEEFVVDSEWLYYEHVARLKRPIEIPDVEAAVAFWMTQKQTYTGRNAVRYPGYRYENRRYLDRHYAGLPMDAIHTLHARLHGVQIFSRDFRDIYDILQRRYDRPNTFIFQDPPYWGVSGGNDYAEQFTWQDHVDLAGMNVATGCRFLLTINDHPDIRALYEGRDGIYLRSYSITYTSATTHEPGTYTMDTTELLVSNYDTEQSFGPLFDLGGIG